MEFLAMRTDWERDVTYNARRRREEGFTPYREMALWRRRFWGLVLIDAAAVALAALAIWGRR